MLSSVIEEQLRQIASQESTYTPNGTVGKELRTKHLIIVVGPAATGKSYLMNRIIEHDQDFGRVSVFTTREARQDDEPGMFRCLPHNDRNVSELLETIRSGNAVQYAVHPTSGRIYGSLLTDYPKTYNMLATLSGIVNHLRELPFARTYVIGLVSEPEIWLKRFYDRYPKASDERTKRLEEAIVSLKWLLTPENQSHIIWADATEEGGESAVQSVINAVKYEIHDSSAARQVAEHMLRRVEEELR